MEHAAGRTAAGRAAARLELEAVRFDWGEAYEIELDDEHGWRAKRRDGLGGWLDAADSAGLYKVIADDYAFRPVPREAGGEP
jgi:hypothetical protein